eukprot:scaffold24439_cov49-Attheya_sp.AAC.2
MGFYVFLNERVLKYTNEGDASKRNQVTYVTDHIEFIQASPTKFPTASPTKFPTASPTKFPTASPTRFPTSNPLASPTKFPTASPTKFPTASPTKFPTSNPPTKFPTASPTKFPTSNPVASPTKFPTKNPTPNPVTTPNPTTKSTPMPTNGATLTPTSKPDEDYVEESRTIFTLLSGGNGQAGNMFEIVALRDITFESVSLHVDTTKTVEFYVFSKQGALENNDIKKYRYLDSITDTPWGDYICHGEVKGNGRGNLTPLPEGSCQKVTIEQGQAHSFYVTLTTGNMDYTNGPSLGAEFAKNNDMIVLVGYGKRFPFHRTYEKRMWNGEFKYTTLNDVDAGETVYPLGPTLISGTSTEGNSIIDGALQSDCEETDDCDTGLKCNAINQCEKKNTRGRGRKRKRRRRGGKRSRRGGT